MKKNRFLSLILALVMLFGMASALGATAMAADFDVWNENGRIKWSSMNNAAYYNLSWYAMNKGGGSSVDGITATSYDLQSFLDNSVASLPDTYRVTVTAISSNGLPLGSTYIDFDYVPTVPVLNTPYPRFVGTAIEWNPVDGANEYRYVVWPGLNPSHTYTIDYAKSGTTKSNHIDLTGWIEPDLYYKIDLMARSNSIKWSDRRISEIVLGADLINGYCSPQEISGTVTIDKQSPVLEDSIAEKYLYYELKGDVSKLPYEKLRVKWQRSSSNSSNGWEDTGEYGLSHTLGYKDIGSYIRVVLTADGYQGQLVSEPVYVRGGSLSEFGTVTISPSGSYSYTGDTITANLSAEHWIFYANKTHYQWQEYILVTAVKWGYADIEGATDRTFTPSSDYSGKQIRVKITADGYDGEVYSEPVTVETRTLVASVTLSYSNPNLIVGETITASLYNDQGISPIPLDKLHYQWERDNGNGGYVNIPGATGITYTIQSSDSDRFLRVTITADGYEGSVTSYIVYIKPSTTPAYPKGDVDRSGQVGNSDLIMVARHVVHILTLTGEQFTLGDMNDDKVIDNKDIISVARKVVGL